MKKFVKGISYKQPELDVNAKYRFSIRRAAICDDVVQLFIEAKFYDEDEVKKREFFLEEIPVNTPLFDYFLVQMYPTEEFGIIEVNPDDFLNFCCYGHIETRGNGEFGIDWRTVELDVSAISATGLFYEAEV